MQRNRLGDVYIYELIRGKVMLNEKKKLIELLVFFRKVHYVDYYKYHFFKLTF